ncbi:ABC transporter substrate-binding protein [Luteimicrobium sp. DT211]|uniref:ABC transporter substrate-binding protein n=1 Tax=Luteimicrobium sp. DT211 TaxID=3393412 RepID=UPI003CFBBEBC
MKKTLAATAVATTALALALTGCATQGSSGSHESGGSSDSVDIMVGGMSKIIYLPAELTEKLGYFKEQGLKVNLIDTPAGVTAETALVANKAQGVVGFYDHTIDMQTKDKCLESVVQFANVPGEAEMVAKKAAPGLASTADLAGKKLGVTSPGSSTDFLTQALTAKAGISTDGYTTVKAGADQTFIAAMNSGGIDAGMTTDPTITMLTTSGDGSVLLDMRTEQGTRDALGGLYPASSLYMSCDWVAAHKDTVQKLANAFVKTLGYIGSHSAKEIADQMPADYKGSDEALYVKSLDASKGIFTKDGVMDESGAKNALAVLGASSPNVKPVKDTVDLSKTYTTEFVKNAG